MRRPGAAQRACVAIGLVLATALALAAPAHARGNGRGSQRVPITQIPRRIIDPLLRDAVRGIQRTFEPIEPEPEPRTTTIRPRTAEPEAPVRAPAPPPIVVEAEPDEPESVPEPIAVAPVPPPLELKLPAESPAERTPLLPVIALASLAAAIAFALRGVRRRRASRAIATAPVAALPALAASLPIASQRATAPRLQSATHASQLARAFVEDGAPDLALADLDEALAGDALERTTPDSLDRYARLLAEAGRPADAVRVLEALRAVDPGRGLATRIEALRKRADALTVPRAAPASPFPAAGRYEILAEIGRGGMGVVYRARDTRLDRIVALKRLSPHLRDHPRAVALLLQEARSAARLNHPNIVTVYDVDHDDGAYFITMELMEGQALDAVVQRRGKLTPKAAAWVGQHAASGLAYAHERRIVHRDVKTANLFITRERSLKIMDFGLAKMVEEVRRRASLIAGTPSYMAPEQAQGIEVDGRADLYALGVTLFELLTGKLPFENGDPAYHHQNTPPPDPREHVQDVPAAFAELVVRLMAKQPEQRPAATSEVAAQLAAFSGS